jgi:hypothetical protein
MAAIIDRANARDPWAESVRQISFRYGMPVSRILELLGHPGCARIGAAEAPPSEIAIAKLQELDRTLEMSCAANWIQRIRESSGAEALFDNELRFLAVSRQGRTLTDAAGKQLELPEAYFRGRLYRDVLPTSDSLLADDEPGLDGLRRLGLFEGRITGAQIELDMRFDLHVLKCIMEIWAVQTMDRGILAHSQIHRLPLVSGEAPTRTGIVVHSVRLH